MFMADWLPWARPQREHEAAVAARAVAERLAELCADPRTMTGVRQKAARTVERRRGNEPVAIERRRRR